ncbi:DUF6371 domain-containing protein [Mangrovibacterium lignilyticum]|uniref:DUF6371 domain-containing protein n=1 Tax=Mangrovibacterium lignilyticum TaxID=2668052 RepID=UPI0013D1CB54|nr:DUF6371 domain-containing protein [Mangrovibacterium lignilyticum]
MKTSTYKYQLEKYTNPSSRYACPRCCEEHQFTRYIDVETGQYIHPDVGKCNRENKCGYHYPPREYFADNGMPQSNDFVMVEAKVRPMSFLPGHAINTNFKESNLYDFLCSHFDANDVDRVMKLYRVGSSTKWSKAVTFYQIDHWGRYRTGKIMAYNPITGRRIKEPFNHIAWVHSDILDFNLKQCLFGEHLLAGNTKPACIVESEKTALIMAIKEPDYI